MATRTSTRRTSRASSASKPSKTEDVYQTVTDTIVRALEAGTVPWRNPWIGGDGRPMRMSNNQPYKGVNVFLLAITSMERGYTSPWWGTFEQVKALGGNVREGQSKANGCGATWVTLWKTFTPKNAEPDGEGRLPQIPMARMFPVFNADQCEHLPDRYYPTVREVSESEVSTAAESIIRGYIDRPYSPLLVHDVHGQAYFNHQTDEIHVPELAEHVTGGRYYSTVFHEMTHSTGHHSRLARRGEHELRQFGSHEYGAEELVAELGAAMLNADAGIASDDLVADNAAYIASWIKTIKTDNRMVISAASAAGKACDFIHGRQLANAGEDSGDGAALRAA